MLAEWSSFEVEMIQAIHQLPATSYQLSAQQARDFHLGRFLGEQSESVTPSPT